MSTFRGFTERPGSTGSLRRKLPPSNIHLHLNSPTKSNCSDFRHSSSTPSLPHHAVPTPTSAPIRSSLTSPFTPSGALSLEPFPVPPWLEEREDRGPVFWANGKNHSRENGGNSEPVNNNDENGVGVGGGGGGGGTLPLKQKKNYTRKNTRHLSQTEPDWTYLWGYLLLGTTFFVFATSLYATVVSKFMPVTGNKILDYISRDTYYCVLVPLTLPISVWWAFWNWMGLKTFRTN